MEKKGRTKEMFLETLGAYKISIDFIKIKVNFINVSMFMVAP